ncbi:uncharacterized protein LOC131049223 [Cryptomeria japonica]|uniref:uncharacterized protein LOC131049223 n=1 Tax=Cryptomeria japonica TaxID=3369 RepID=UPI0027DA2282|nr:uncharacterized protein LOC131049223 [Cryptomeria japonica]
MVAEVLSQNFSHLIRNKIISGVKVASTLPPVVMQQFVDDTFLFGQSSVIEAKEWKHLLEDYALASGQLINYNKSKIYFFNTDRNLQNKIIHILGCCAANLPGSYLGLPLTVKEVTPKFWESILERMQKKLAGWSGKTLSGADKLQLLSASLQGVPVYFLSLFKISIAMVEKLEKIQRSFLWTGMEEKARISLVNWELVYKPKYMGGLGIRISDLNKALLTKITWNLVMGNADSCKIMRAKYFNHTPFSSLVSSNDLPSGSKIWSNIVKS